jgi:hypothetical protein
MTRQPCGAVAWLDSTEGPTAAQRPATSRVPQLALASFMCWTTSLLWWGRSYRSPAANWRHPDTCQFRGPRRCPIPVRRCNAGPGTIFGLGPTSSR